MMRTVAANKIPLMQTKRCIAKLKTAERRVQISYFWGTGGELITPLLNGVELCSAPPGRGVAPHAHILHLKNETFSRDPNVVQALNDDPLCGQETQPSQTMAAMVRADERVKQGFPLIKLPVLILHGTLDKNAKPTGSQLFYDTAGSADKTLKLYEGSFHDLLNDLDKEVVMADIKSWLNARLPATLGMPARSHGASVQKTLSA